jgi:hypothetical protein
MARWRGSKELKPGKADWDFSSSKTSVTTSYTGSYSNCLAHRPALAAEILAFPDLYVTSAKVVELDAGAGRIDLVLEAAVDSSTFSTEPLGEPTYENEWAEVQKPLETHPECGFLTANRDKYKDGVQSEDGKQRTWEDWQSLTDNDYDSSPGWSLEQYKSLKERGVDSYVVFQPIVRRTTIHLARPVDLGAASGKRQTPPGAANFSRISDFEWLGGADRCTKSKRTYTRTTEWQGAELWDELVYPD